MSHHAVHKAPVLYSHSLYFTFNECHINWSNNLFLTTIYGMPKKSPHPIPSSHLQRLTSLGERLRAARLRRKFTTTLMAERMGVSRETLRRIELGDASVALGNYFAALHALGLGTDLDLLAQDDALGRQLQDASLMVQRKPRGRKPQTDPAAPPTVPPQPNTHPSVAAALAKFKKKAG